jgi:hypothetical protein
MLTTMYVVVAAGFFLHKDAWPPHTGTLQDHLDL